MLEFVIEAATKHWGTKAMAFLLALLVFIVTRDEVTRSFTIPLVVVEDPERVLLTEPPATVEVRLRGPWADVNRIASAELGPASLDLREVRPGPMTLDPASVVMPRGVVLDQLLYDPVDLRFEAMVERGFMITAAVSGELDGDHRLVTTRVEPDSWRVRGRESALDEFAGLRTRAIDVSDARGDLDQRVELDAIGVPGIEFTGVASGERPVVRFVAVITPVAGELELEVATGAALRAALLPADHDEMELPASERVVVRGPLTALRELEGLDAAIVPVVEIEPVAKGGAARGAPLPVTLRFEWSEEVPEQTRARLSIVPPLIRLRLAQADR